MSRILPPKVLTVDDGDKIIPRGQKSKYEFVFSDDISDWITSKQKKFNKESQSRLKGNKDFKQKHG